MTQLVSSQNCERSHSTSAFLPGSVAYPSPLHIQPDPPSWCSEQGGGGSKTWTPTPLCTPALELVSLHPSQLLCRFSRKPWVLGFLWVKTTCASCYNADSWAVMILPQQLWGLPEEGGSVYVEMVTEDVGWGPCLERLCPGLTRLCWWTEGISRSQVLDESKCECIWECVWMCGSVCVCGVCVGDVWVWACDCQQVSIYEWARQCEHMTVWVCKCERSTVHTGGGGTRPGGGPHSWVAVERRCKQGEGCRCPGRRRRRASVWDAVKSTAVVAGTGGRRFPTAALLFLRTQAPVLWLSPEASRYKKVSCVGHGKWAKKTIWTWEGIWARAWQAAGPSWGAHRPAASLPVARGHAHTLPGRWGMSPCSVPAPESPSLPPPCASL